MKNVTTTAAVAALSILALASCGKQIEGAGTTAKAAQPAAAASSGATSDAGNFPTPEPADLQTSDAEPVAEETPEEPAAPESIRFGQTWEWEDGVTVTVSKPEKFKPSYTAMGGDGFKTHVRFTITLKNGSKEKLELFGTPTIVSGDTEGEAVFDTAKGLNGPPDSKVQPGRTVKFKVGYGVTNTTDLVLEYAPTFSHDDATFTSK
ncbi:hypothetical protein UB45_07540 [Terrabacter sp. 28]|jgi:hypothetical protein|nr:hypothetical protein UB45_07540 [Terrabacter sp. 28]